MATHAAATSGPGAIALLTLASPLWLFGLTLLPAIRWLHRGGRHRRAVQVSRLALWAGSAASTPAAGERQPPDPAWRRRAMLAALLFVALAEPQWPQQRTQVTLWVDDTLSMLTRETHGTRLVEGLAKARSLLAEVGHVDAEIRALGNPWHNLGAPTDTVVATLAAGAGQNEPNAPPGGLLRRDRLHWLITDGAHAMPLEWPGGVRPDRIIQVGDVTRNVGLERLSARRNANDPEKLDLLLKVTNGGTAAETRAVVVTTDLGQVVRTTERLDAGTSALVELVISASASVSATLEPADALAEDDRISLDLSPLRRRRVATDSRCPGALVAAVIAHPALSLEPYNANGVDVALDCGTPDLVPDVATIRVLADSTPRRPTGSLQWPSTVPASRGTRLDTEHLRLAARLQTRSMDTVLLAVGDEPVIVSRAGEKKRLETSLDFASMGSTAAAEVPLLVNLMFEHILGSALLDAIAITDRGRGAASVVPVRRADTPASERVTIDSNVLRDKVRPFLVLAVLGLLWEVVALGRQWLRLRVDDVAEAT